MILIRNLGLKKTFFNPLFCIINLVNIVILLVVINGCKSLKQERNMESKDVKVNASIFISLPGKGTSGLLWDYKIENDGIVNIERVDYGEDLFKGSPQPAVGSSIPEVFKVTGVKSGTTKIYFEQRRPWEKTSPPVDKQDFEVAVTD